MSTIVLFGLALLLLLPSSAASQEVALPVDEPEPPHEAAPPREWATLEVSFSPPAELSATLGQQVTMAVSVTNHGNIPALGALVTLEGSQALAATAVKAGDLKAGETVMVEVPVELFGRFADPHPFSVRVTAENVAQPTVLGAEQTFAKRCIITPPRRPSSSAARET
jgi:hypothetical protein